MIYFLRLVLCIQRQTSGQNNIRKIIFTNEIFLKEKYKLAFIRYGTEVSRTRQDKKKREKVEFGHLLVELFNYIYSKFVNKFNFKNLIVL